MIKITKILATSVVLLGVYSGQFVALASFNQSGKCDDSYQRKNYIAIAQEAAEVKQYDDINPQSTSVDVLQEEFMPFVPCMDIKIYLTGIMCEVVSPSILSQVSKTWHAFILGAEFVTKKSTMVSAVPFSARNPLTQQYMLRWLNILDKRILAAGICRYTLQGTNDVYNVMLSTMDAKNGNLILPSELGRPWCIMRNHENFLRTTGDKDKSALILLMTLGELKHSASRISGDAKFLRGVSQTDISQNAICAFSRNSEDDIAIWGFKYLILPYREMTGLKLSQIFTHEKVHTILGTRYEVQCTHNRMDCSLHFLL